MPASGPVTVHVTCSSAGPSIALPAAVPPTTASMPANAATFVPVKGVSESDAGMVTATGVDHSAHERVSVG